ncbi:tobamovirus multiplication 1 [Prunus dulcis]|uniref:Tobamovirus multiplication 1 n=1 Tax=Prunus dulcis TaxID=3755 RepID=A0A4Y1RXQ8_PRUDU|nr:tobamovirus multiplication 1 [Prunus dulcis]
MRKSFLFSYSGGADDWWNEIGGSKQWQSGPTYYILSASYALVSLVALVQLVRIQLRVPEYGWTIQKVFHLMNFLVNGLRAVLFGLYKSVLLIKPKALEMLLMDLPGLLFFSTYTLLVLFWAEIYHQARSLPTDKLRPAYYIINGFIYFTQPKSCCLISFGTALGFLIYGGRLFIMLRHFPIESRGRQKKLEEVGWVTGICCTCFLIRCLVLAVSAFDKDADVDVLAEIVPSALVLFILRKVPPRRVSDQYQPIK